MTLSLTCPLCGEALYNANDSKVFTCVNNHSFDLAKQGYINLLPVQQKRSKTPGDDKDMVLARQTFLNNGYYSRLATRLAQLVDPTASTLLDAGCGEGYYLEQILKQHPQLSGCGIDISKHAIIKACQRSKNLTQPVTWLVASLKSIPLASQSVDSIVSVFSPILSDPFKSVLKPGGQLITVHPNHNHLHQLKAQLYDTVKTADTDKPAHQLPAPWVLEHQETLHYTLELNHSAHIQALVAMTPHTWRASPTNKARVSALNQLSCDAQFTLSLWRLTS